MFCIPVAAKSCFITDCYENGSPDGSGGVDWACACFGFNIRKVPAAVNAAYFPIFLMASFLVILLGSSFFIVIGIKNQKLFQ